MTLRLLFRRLFRRCLLCGARRVQPKPGDYHSRWQKRQHERSPFCRPCTKMMNFSTAFGMSDTRARQQVVHR